MNLEQQPPLPPPLQSQPPLQPSSSSSSRFNICHSHPEESLTGFCASCLRERLVGLDSSTSTSISTSSHRKTSTTTTALKAIFRNSAITADNTTTNNNNNQTKKDPSSSSFLPELRRCKSFSGRKAEGLSVGFEPKRKSCDVRGLSTLWNLISKEEERKSNNNKETRGAKEVETRNLGVSGVGDSVFETIVEPDRENREEIRVPIVTDVVDEEVEEEEEVEEDEEEEEEEKEKVITMKDHINRDSQNKKHSGKDLKEIAGNFWSAASVFSKKLQKWRSKQKTKKSETSTNGLSSTLPIDKPQSEMADYGYEGRSCDIDSRFSLDIGRMSFDDPRYSLDEPRASWDGYLIGRTFPKLAPMVSVVEDVPIPVKRSDNQIPVVETSNSINGDDTTPGGTSQTRDYYNSDSSQRRRKSFDRSNSIRKKTSAVGAEMDDMNSVPTSKVSPTNIDLFHGAKLVGTDRDLRDSRSNSVTDDRSESRESASVSCNLDQKELKKSSRWSKAWNIWGLINKRNPSSKDEEEEMYNNRGNVIERSYSESWQDLRKVGVNGGGSKGGINKRVLRSNSSVSSRNAVGAFGSSSSKMRNVADINECVGKNKREEFVLERSRSARYSSNEVADNGLLRFYLTPLRNNKRSLSGNGRSKNPQSIARRVLRFY